MNDQTVSTADPQRLPPLTRDRKIEIEKIADRLISRHGSSKLPFDVEEISENLDPEVRVLYVEFKDEAKDRYHGLFDFKSCQIYVNKEDTVDEKLFTIAHELGHHVLLHTDYLQGERYVPRMKGISEPKNVEEQEADYFACSLIAPRRIVEKYKDFASESELETLFLTNHSVIKKALSQR